MTVAMTAPAMAPTFSLGQAVWKIKQKITNVDSVIHYKHYNIGLVDQPSTNNRILKLAK